MIFMPLLLLTACLSGQRSRMLALLDEADSLNRAYAQLPSDTLLLEAADFFDRHGSRNEQVRAHYLLGCAYRDQGQAPEALQAWQDALDNADSLSSDSTHNALMCRLYSQMGALYYQQNLLADNIECMNYSIKYAMKCNDTLVALNSYMLKMGAFSRQNQLDSVVAICENAYRFAEKHDFIDFVAGNVMIAVPAFLELNQYDRASYYISLYEKKSGYVDSTGMVAKGHEVYYYLKGLYLLSERQYDSAESYFRRELQFGSDFNNQNGGAIGLARLYHLTNKADSAAKYALYGYDMNDSVYIRMATADIEQMKCLYDYSKHQSIAEKERKKSEKESRKVKFLVNVFIFLSIFVLSLVWYFIQRQKNARKRYLDIIDKFNIVQKDLLLLRSNEKRLNRVISEKESQMDAFRSELARFRRRAKMDIRDTKEFQSLQEKAILGIEMTENDWDEVNRLVIEYLPVFHQFISNREYELNIREYRMCLLLRLDVKPSNMSHMFNFVPSFITKMSKSIHQKLFKSDGLTKDLTMKLKGIR